MKTIDTLVTIKRTYGGKVFQKAVKNNEQYTKLINSINADQSELELVKVEEREGLDVKLMTTSGIKEWLANTDREDLIKALQLELSTRV